MTKEIKVNYYDIIRRPIITEKANIAAENSKFIFEVLVSADKVIIKKAVEAIFNVKVTQINISNSPAKIKFYKGREGVRKGYKKAVVTLQQGQTIDFTAGV